MVTDHVMPHIHGAELFNWLPERLNAVAASVVHKAKVEIERMHIERGKLWKDALEGDFQKRKEGLKNYEKTTNAQHKFAVEHAELATHFQFLYGQVPHTKGLYVNPALLGAEHLNQMPQYLHPDTQLAVHEAEARMRVLQDERMSHQHHITTKGRCCKMPVSVHKRLLKKRQRPSNALPKRPRGGPSL